MKPNIFQKRAVIRCVEAEILVRVAIAVDGINVLQTDTKVAVSKHNQTCLITSLFQNFKPIENFHLPINFLVLHFWT